MRYRDSGLIRKLIGKFSGDDVGIRVGLGFILVNFTGNVLPAVFYGGLKLFCKLALELDRGGFGPFGAYLGPGFKATVT